MGRAPYQSAIKGGVGTVSSVSTFNHKRLLMSYVYSNSISLKQIIQAIMHIEVPAIKVKS